MNLSLSTLKLLETIENCLDPEVEDDYNRQWDEFIDHKFKGDIFYPLRKKNATHDYQYQNIYINDAIADYEKMLVSQMEPVLRMLERGKGVLGVRSNYGTGIMSSLFGTEIYMMPYKTNTLPTTRGLGADALDMLIDKGVPSLDVGFGKNVFEMGEIFKDVFAKYPKIQKYVNIYHPDEQGPLDATEVLIGSDMFYLPYDDPDGFKQILSIMTETIIKYLDKWYTLVPKTPERSTHWGGFVHKGNLVLREDSAMNLSPEAYREFGLPYDTILLDRYDGGIIHFCGRGDHYIDIISDIPKLYGINMSQPHLNDMEKIYKYTVDKGLQIVNFSSAFAERDKNRPGCFSHNMHGC